MKRYIVRLEAGERACLEQLVHRGKTAAARIRRANVLLAADQSDAGPAKTDVEISQTLNVAVRTVEYLRKRLVEEGLDAALEAKKRERPAVEPMFDGEKEARLVAITCGPKPKGRKRWTLKLLADRVVELKIVERCSAETVRRVLQKMS